MPEDNTINDMTNPAPVKTAQDDTNSGAEKQPSASTGSSDNSNIISEVVKKINEAQNILIALSGDPSVDEMAAAIGLSLFLDKLGKRATAIYSGATPNALEFLKPEETFEPTTDALQDFVIALNKEKADHLRYKLDGDYVKIYITPYKTRISENDLDYSYGDFNIDLVLALDVANGIDLDSALREHGRIMHDAVIINITTGNPGKLGEIEWSDKSASSISEMVARLIYDMKSESKMEKDEATAFLTGIVAATNRFSNAKTTAESMNISSMLMESGANQQLISKNITPETENELFNNSNISEEIEVKKDDGSAESAEKTEGAKEEVADSTKLDIRHDKEEPSTEAPAKISTVVPTAPEEPAEKETPVEETNEPDLLDDLKAAEATLSLAGAETTPEKVAEPVKIDSENSTIINEPNNEEEEKILETPEKVIQPLDGAFDGNLNELNNNKYGKMLEDALSSIGDDSSIKAENNQDPSSNNPATINTPAAPTTPEINGVPSMNYLPLPGDETLPPPPTPPIDMSSVNQEIPTVQQTAIPEPNAAPITPITPAAPTPEPTPETLGDQPAMQDQVYAPQASDPGAFKIPGM